MQPEIERIVKILELEREQGCRDRAVEGGLGAFAERWGVEAASELPELQVSRVTGALQGYPDLDATEREIAVINALRAARGIRRGKGAPAGRERPAPAAPAEPVAAPEAAEPPDPERELRLEDHEDLDRPVLHLRGVGEKVAERLARLGITTIRELVLHAPARYQDFSQVLRIDQLHPGQPVTVAAAVWRVRGRSIRGNRHLLEVVLNDTTGSLSLSFFNQPYLEKRFRPGQQVIVSGKVESRAGRLGMSSPEWETVDQRRAHTSRLVPVYPLTEGLKQRWLRRQMQQAVERWAEAFGDPLPAELRRAQGLMPLPDALRELHFPQDEARLRAARLRLAFDELLTLQLWARRRRRARRDLPGVSLAEGLPQMRRFVDALPFALTEAGSGSAEGGGQREALAAIVDDISRPEPMSRLLQGDVGCGKTAVAGAAMVMCVGAGQQAALMAPTEILAEQHHRSLLGMLEALGYRAFDPKAPEAGAGAPRLARLVGSMSARDKQITAEALAEGRVELVVGTHAVIQEQVAFARLGLVIVDEQHRFGVMQRAELQLKGRAPAADGTDARGGEAPVPHQLIMTATPIPRTLALALNAEVDQSVIERMPPGRKPIQTYLRGPNDRGRVHAFIRRRVAEGQQAYIVYPLVEASESIEARSAVEDYEHLAGEVFADLEVGLLHGQLRPAEKDAVMRRFQAGEIDVLVATSVIEVGVDVPKATVMLIENAERFGLAQLHQFRGRVGRGEDASVCVLISEARGESTARRLQAMVETVPQPDGGEGPRGGMQLAEVDLELRGPGDFFGLQQSGVVDRFRFARLAPTEALGLASRVAEQLMRQDPELEAEALQALRRRVEAFTAAAARV